MLHDACHPPLTPTHEIPVTHTPYCCTKQTDDAAFIMLNLVSCDTHTLDGSGSSLSVGWSPSRGWVSSSSPGSRLRGLLSARGLSSCRMQRDAEHCRGGYHLVSVSYSTPQSCELSIKVREKGPSVPGIRAGHFQGLWVLRGQGAGMNTFACVACARAHKHTQTHAHRGLTTPSETHQ